VLVGRIAATLANHEPGWRLPRSSELARRHNVSASEASAAIEYLVACQLIRRSPDGRLYRAGPADYLISLENMAGLGATVDPMGRELTCLSYGAARRPAPEDAACALGMRSGEPVGVLRVAWALDGRPAATSTTYLAAGLPEPRALTGWVTTATEHGALPMRPPSAGHDNGHLRPRTPPRAVTVQMDLAPTSVARRLGLAPGQMAVLVTALFGNRPGHRPAALTVAVLRPDMFRITVDTATQDAGGQRLLSEWSLAEWSLAAGDPAV
jgi:DNA-binding GntR family transcriptional regulator